LQDAEILEYALEGRRRVKEQLKKIGGMEFYDVHFSYLDNDTFEEHFVSVPSGFFCKIHSCSMHKLFKKMST